MAFDLNNSGLTTDNNQDVVEFLVDILKQLRYGSIEIVVHDGRIVQIDKRERFRVDAKPK